MAKTVQHLSSTYRNHGQRVVAGQRYMQATSDIFLGWLRVARGSTGRNTTTTCVSSGIWKASADVDAMMPEALVFYAEMCAWTLARAHARSGDPLTIGSYIGGGDAFPQVLARFAVAYADQNDLDHRGALRQAIDDGTVHADTTF